MCYFSVPFIFLSSVCLVLMQTRALNTASHRYDLAKGTVSFNAQRETARVFLLSQDYVVCIRYYDSSISCSISLTSMSAEPSRDHSQTDWEVCPKVLFQALEMCRHHNCFLLETCTAEGRGHGSLLKDSPIRMISSESTDSVTHLQNVFVFSLYACIQFPKYVCYIGKETHFPVITRKKNKKKRTQLTSCAMKRKCASLPM